MASQEAKARRFLTGKKINSNKPVVSLNFPDFLKKDWYLSSWFEKLLFVFGFFSMLYFIFTLLIFGVPWK